MKKIILLLFIISTSAFTISCSKDEQEEEEEIQNNHKSEKPCYFKVEFISDYYRYDMWIPNSTGGLDQESFVSGFLPNMSTKFVEKEYQNYNNQIFKFEYLNATDYKNYFHIWYKVKYLKNIDGFSGSEGNDLDASVPAGKRLIILLDPSKKLPLSSYVE